MSANMKTIVQLTDLVKHYEEVGAVDHIDLTIYEGEFITFLGPSGCGKTTTLRMIAGFEEPTAGKIQINGVDVHDKYPHERDVNTVFQSYALFPHMDIYHNIAFGLKMKKVSKEEIKERVMKVLKLVQLEGYEHRKPAQLSGGQKQRIAIARALVNEPKVLLLDEPLGALDLKLRKQMQVELKHLQKQLGITFVYVTHDQEEALTMSDRIAIMNKGKIEQLGTVEDIYERPRTRFVADFIGETNLIEAKILRQESQDRYRVEMLGKEFLAKGEGFSEGQKVCVTLRPERISINKSDSADETSMKVRFKEDIYIGSIIKTVMITDCGREIFAVSHPGQKSYEEYYKEGQEVTVSWTVDQCLLVEG